MMNDIERALLLGGIAYTDRHQALVVSIGSGVVLGLSILATHVFN